MSRGGHGIVGSRTRFRTPLSIVFAEVATHNHFVLDRGGKVFKQTAPVIKLTAEASEDDHLALLGLLNSSTACFWMKQSCHCKGSTVDQHGARQTTVPFEDFYAFNASKLQQFPLPSGRPLALARKLDKLAQAAQGWTPAAVLAHWAQSAGEDLRDNLRQAEQWAGMFRRKMIALQEELDWQCYRLYGLLDEDLTWPAQEDALETRLGQRAFEIVLARKMGFGLSPSPNNTSNATDRASSVTNQASSVTNQALLCHKSGFICDKSGFICDKSSLLCHKSGFIYDKSSLICDESGVERRSADHLVRPARGPRRSRKSPGTGPRRTGGWWRGVSPLIERDKAIGLIERPEYKRRWNTEAWTSQAERALREWLLARLESYFDFDGRMNEEGAPTAKLDVALCSLAQLADAAQRDARFQEAGAVYTDDPAFDALKLVSELVESESAPLLPVLRYKDSGLRKRAEWERVWALQRQEDAIEARGLSPDEAKRVKKQEVGAIPAPPKYASGDFLKTHYWKLRGKLDVPKERWVSFPHCEGQDGTLMIAWAGYNHLQLARAISAHYVDVQERLGGRDDPRLVPLLASLIELLPWAQAMAQ